MNARYSFAAVIAVTAFTFARSALAADNCSGEDVLVSKTASTLDLGKGHTLTVTNDHSIVLTDNLSDIYNNTTGECAGSFLSTPDGKVRGSGHCLRKDKDGDTYSIDWSLAPGAAKGVWRATGGTGKFAGRNNSGWFQQAVADGKMIVTRWGGNCQ